MRFFNFFCRDADFFANIAVDAIQRVGSDANESKTKDGPRYAVKNVNIVKVHGKSQRDSTLVDGIAMYQTRAAQGMMALSDPRAINRLTFTFSLHTEFEQKLSASKSRTEVSGGR